MAGILDFFMNSFFLLSDAGLALLDFMNKIIDIPGFASYTVLEVLFGVGLPIYFTYSIFKYLIPI